MANGIPLVSDPLSSNIVSVGEFVSEKQEHGNVLKPQAVYRRKEYGVEYLEVCSPTSLTPSVISLLE